MRIRFLPFVMLLLFAGSSAFAVNIDGVLSPLEYSREVSLDKGNFKILWQIEGETIFMAIEAKAPGWVAIGFEPTNVMANSDMIFGLVGEGKDVQAVDAWSTGIFGPHPPDVDQGGKNSILSFSGLRKDGNVVFEFSRLLNTGDKFDKVIPKTGNFKVIWAYGPNLKFTVSHKRAGSVVLVMDGTK